MPKNPSTHTVCGAKSRITGDPCQKRAGWGTPHPGYGYCKLHGGSTRTHCNAAAKLEGADVVIAMGLATETEPHDGLLEALWTAKGLADYAGHMLALLSTKEELARSTPSDDVRYWTGVRREAVRDMAHFARSAMDAGVAERQTRMVERMGGALADLLSGVLGELQLTAEQEARAPQVVQRHLEIVSGRVA